MPLSVCARAAALALAVLGVAGCGGATSAKPLPNAATTEPATGLSTPQAGSGAPDLTGCPVLDVTSLDAVVPGLAWAAGPAATPALGLCVLTATITGTGQPLRLIFAPNAHAVATVSSFRASPPPLPSLERLGDLGVGVPSAGAASQTGADVSIVAEAAPPRVLVSLLVSLTQGTLHGGSHHDVARALMAWALHLKIK